MKQKVSIRSADYRRTMKEVVSKFCMICACSMLIVTIGVITATPRPADAGWPTFIVKYENKTYPVLHVTSVGAVVKNITAVPHGLEIKIELQSDRDGQVQVAIPKELLNATRISYDSNGFVPGVFVDKIDSQDYTAVPRSNDIIFTIPFEAGTEEIEIVGSEIPEFGSSVRLAIVVVSMISGVLAMQRFWHFKEK